MCFGNLTETRRKTDYFVPGVICGFLLVLQVNRMKDFKSGFLLLVFGLPVLLIGFVAALYFGNCGFNNDCSKASLPPVLHTPIPTLIPATLPLAVAEGPTKPAGNAAASTAAPAATSVTESAVPTATSGITPSTSPTSMATSAATAEASDTPGAETSTPAAAPGTSDSGVPIPSHPGGTGVAITLKGDPKSGAQIFAANCALCHGDEGKGGVVNSGSSDGTVPTLNPIDPALANPDYATFAKHIDLFIQHGSVPEGPNPTFTMPAWGDQNLLSQQQIADVMAYVIGLNGVKPAAFVPAGYPVAMYVYPQFMGTASYLLESETCQASFMGIMYLWSSACPG
jgi:mono/diheme cytochrome c family protein